MNSLPEPHAMVFSDLDGSLLDHHTYAFDAAQPAISELAARSIPLVLCSSKTRAEIEPIRARLGNSDPFIVENGAAIFVPHGWLDGAFSAFFSDTGGVESLSVDGYFVHASSDTRTRWLAVLELLQVEYGDEFDCFSRMGTPGIAAMTGLNLEDAALANQREFSEPVHWKGSDQRRESFVAELESHGATVAQGGRFLGVTGSCDKGKALQWLVNATASCLGCEHIESLAIGDSGNDVPMLEVAESALVIRSPVHDFPTLVRGSDHRVMRSHEPGPVGWNDGVMAWMREHSL